MANPEVLRSHPAVINPYRVAWNMIRDRLRWDRNPVSRDSRKKLRALRDRHAGERAVILCNGPSLLQSDLGLLADTFTFGLNKINLLFDKDAFRPSCIVAVNKLVLEQNRAFYNDTAIPLFLDSAALELGVDNAPHVHFLHNVNHRRFARDCSWSIYQGYTVTYVALQLAFHMGFRQVALIGADHYFSTPGQPNQTVTSSSEDPNHFDPNYFAGGVQWQLPDLAESELSYIMARDVFAAFGGRVVNATVGGHLEIFERQPLEDFLA
ncbi:MAG: 6-hydroxymethylpterin diphosphokinase MptE-like protein [Gammaproteobacteria bacterium]